MATALKNKNSGWTKTVLNDPKYFQVVGSGVDVWMGKKNFLSTKSVQGTKIVSIESEIDYFNRPSRANMQPKVGRVAFAKMRDTFKVLLTDEELSKFYILSTGFALIEPKIESAYLYQVLQTQRFNLQKDRYAEGSTQQAISQSDFDKLTISFPEDRQEQCKIAEVFSTIDDAIEKTDALIEKYKRMKIGIMQDLFRYGVDDKGKIRSEKTHKFKNSPLGKIPDEWDVGFLDVLGQRGSGHTPSKSHPEYWNGGIKWVSLADTYKLDDLYIRDTEQEISNEGIKHSSAVLHPAGTVIVSRDAAVGKSAILSEPMAVSQHFIVWRCGERLDNHYLYYWLQNDKRSFETIALGSTIVTIGLSFFKNYRIPFPKSVVEQKRIASSLIGIENLINTEVSYSEKLSALKAGLMEDLLTGIVRTNHLISK